MVNHPLTVKEVMHRLVVVTPKSSLWLDWSTKMYVRWGRTFAYYMPDLFQIWSGVELESKMRAAFALGLRDWMIRS